MGRKVDILWIEQTEVFHLLLYEYLGGFIHLALLKNL
jgi:hypothetical protein